MKIKRLRTTALKAYLVFHGDRVPGHIDALNGTKGGEGLPDGILPQLVINGAHIHTTHDGQSSLPLCCHLVVMKGRENRREYWLLKHKKQGKNTKHKKQ